MDENQNDLENKPNPKSLATFAHVCFKEDSKKVFQLKSWKRGALLIAQSFMKVSWILQDVLRINIMLTFPSELTNQCGVQKIMQRATFPQLLSFIHCWKSSYLS